MAYTPMMLQYLAAKEECKDSLLFFRLGDFYEMFFEDAIVASRDMDVVLTKKACGEGEFAPMCGVPYHSAESYIAKLIAKGHKVAIAEQMEDPALAKGIVKREITRIITPGTVTGEGMLPESDNNFLSCVYIAEDAAGLSWCDISTGEFSAVELKDDPTREKLSSWLTKTDPKEIITNVDAEGAPGLWSEAKFSNVYISVPGDDIFLERNCSLAIRTHFETAHEKSAGLSKEDAPLLFYAVGGLLGYLRNTQKQEVTHLSALNIRFASSSMSLDKATVKNLELTETLFEGNIKGSLFGVIDRTQTSMGARRLKQWLREPLNIKKEIDLRLDAVEALKDDILLRNDLREALKGIYDLERLSARISLGTANARDLTALKNSLLHIPDVKSALSGVGAKLTDALNSDADPLLNLSKLLTDALADDPPFTIREGGMIKSGFSKELDDLVSSVEKSRDWISGLEGEERERTGIKNLRVSYNKVFGYYIEISRGQLENVPENYIRKQTLVNAERYITPELKEAESLVLNAQGKINELEYRIFCELREKAKEATKTIQQTARALSKADALSSLAQAAEELGYVKPLVTEGGRIVIKKGRHPVIEHSIKDGVYVSNDVYMDKKTANMLLITGPNMSGKSTYMRQLALIVLMAQAGSFVPAAEAEIGICDRIYTRIGASDNIAMGQSTFFVEMSELAYILNTATEKSLVILDEIGRGTSTYDGLSIAWAVAAYLADPKRRVRTLFATHYHELTVLPSIIKGVKNLSVDVAESGGDIVFLHKITEGSASRSYGIHVAKLAGVPKTVLDAAEKKLRELEEERKEDEDGFSVKEEGAHVVFSNEQSEQLSFFNPKEGVITQKIKNLDIMNITPSEAIRILDELVKAARDE